MTRAEATIIVTFICPTGFRCQYVRHIFSNLVPRTPQHRILSACSGNWFTNCVNCHCIRSQFVKCSFSVVMKNYFSVKKSFVEIFQYFFHRIKSKSRITSVGNKKSQSINIERGWEEIDFFPFNKTRIFSSENFHSFIFSRVTAEKKCSV